MNSEFHQLVTEYVSQNFTMREAMELANQIMANRRKQRSQKFKRHFAKPDQTIKPIEYRELR